MVRTLYGATEGWSVRPSYDRWTSRLCRKPNLQLRLILGLLILRAVLEYHGYLLLKSSRI